MTRPKALLLLSLCWPALADSPVDALRTTLIGMRGAPAELGATRRTPPQLPIAKNALRDWIESRLPALAERGDEQALASTLNTELRDAGLFCEADAKCPDWTRMGFLEEVKLSRSGSFLILRTGVGIDQCGFDGSAYLYSSSAEGWKRVWQTEQNSYTEKEYKPQTVHAVLVSPYNRSNDYLVLTLGSNPWCTSNWQPLYYRVFRPGPDLESKPLINGEEEAFGPGNAQGSVTSNEALVEFRIQSIDSSVHNRAAVRHFQIDHDQVKRLDPLALSPRDFVDEWLTHEWRDAVVRSESANRGAMRQQHTKLHKDPVFGEFQDPTMHCPQMPDLWQVGVVFSEPPATKGAEPQPTYFLVRWRPPYIFTWSTWRTNRRRAATRKTGRQTKTARSSRFGGNKVISPLTSVPEIQIYISLIFSNFKFRPSKTRLPVRYTERGKQISLASDVSQDLVFRVSVGLA